MRIPLEFVSFALLEGQMYKTSRKRDTFVVTDGGKRSYGNSVVYGGLFLLRDFDFYIRLLDANFLCSKSTLLRNHVNDFHWRTNVDVTPIHFDSLDDLKRLKYRESNVVKACLYLGNQHNPNISSRIRQKIHSYRVISGIDSEYFKKLYEVVG